MHNIHFIENCPNYFKIRAPYISDNLRLLILAWPLTSHELSLVCPVIVCLTFCYVRGHIEDTETSWSKKVLCNRLPILNPIIIMASMTYAPELVYGGQMRSQISVPHLDSCMSQQPTYISKGIQSNGMFETQVQTVLITGSFFQRCNNGQSH